MQFRTQTLVWSAAGLLAVGTATGLSAPTLLDHKDSSPTANATQSRLIPLIATPNYRAIVAQNQAAVVGVTTASEMHIAASNPTSPDAGDPLAQLFRGMPMPQNHGVAHAQGSGFVISADGVVLTNAHVVDGAREVIVKLSDHREFKAKVLGSDKASDIAVLKIDAHNLATVQLGNSEQLGVGDYVLAIGQPFGLEETATAGIVSAKGRSLPGNGYVPFIQTDAAVNPGNSGGPLFDANGEVVGINAQIYSNSGGYQGVSFAIPINLAVQIKDQIVKTGKAEHARLGVQVQTLDQSLANSFKLKSPNGALVGNVEPDSAAQQAGIKVGDVILKVNDTPIIDAGQLSATVGATTPGTKATLDLWREGKPLRLTVTIGSTSPLTASVGGTEAPARLGLSLRPLSAEERQQAGISGIPGGLVVEAAQGRAADAGIQPGDVVVSVDGTPVQTVEQMRKLVADHDQQIALLIQRGASRLFIPVDLG